MIRTSIYFPEQQPFSAKVLYFLCPYGTILKDDIVRAPKGYVLEPAGDGDHFKRYLRKHK